MTQALSPLADTAEFDDEIALVLATSHWRTAALFLKLTAQYAEAGDFISLDRNRRRAREQFLDGPPPRHGDAEQPETRA